MTIERKEKQEADAAASISDHTSQHYAWIPMNQGSMHPERATDDTRFYSVGLGGEVSYVFPSAPVNLKLRVTEDLAARNLVPGTGTVISVNAFF